MPHDPEARPFPLSVVAPPVAPPTTAPTQSLGIREAQADPNPADPTRKVHSDSVPLAGAPQPSRRDQVMPSAEPVAPEIDDTSEIETPPPESTS